MKLPQDNFLKSLVFPGVFVNRVRITQILSGYERILFMMMNTN